MRMKSTGEMEMETRKLMSAVLPTREPEEIIPMLMDTFIIPENPD